jgi:hypothetical protein
MKRDSGRHVGCGRGRSFVGDNGFLSSSAGSYEVNGL